MLRATRSVSSARSTPCAATSSEPARSSAPPEGRLKDCVDVVVSGRVEPTGGGYDALDVGRILFVPRGERGPSSDRRCRVMGDPALQRRGARPARGGSVSAPQRGQLADRAAPPRG